MNAEMTGPDVVVDHEPGAIFYRRSDVSLEAIKRALTAQGKVLKSSPHSETRLVDSWVVKASRRNSIIGAVKHAAERRRYRHAWIAARHLESHGVAVPTPRAFVEFNRYGLTLASAFVMDYLAEHCNVEHYAGALVQQKASGETIHAYLAALAEAVNALVASGAYHADLSGKNILTRDGARFVFIDLEGVEIGRPYTPRLRLKNHTQLYDSFCDFWDDEFLEPFLARMIPDDVDYRGWCKRVRMTQRMRRARQMSIWRRQGRSL